jgi:DNA (cytosine-5)-methyltransferase 1
MLSFGAMAAHFRPKWVVWENVPGVLSSNKGRDFGAFLGMLAELGYGFAYRVLDAQYFGVAQRRRRVFVVGHLGDWRCAAAVLFESESLSGNPPPSRKKGEGFAAEVAPSLTASGRGVERVGESRGQDPVVACYGLPGNWINRKPENGGNATAPMNDVSPCLTGADRHAVCLMGRGGQIMNVEHDKTGTLRAQMRGHVPIVYDCRGVGDGKTVPTLCTDQPAKVGDHCPIVIYGQGGKGTSNITIENISPTLCSSGNGNIHVVCMAHGQANAEILCDKSPTLNCSHEQPIVFNAQGSHHQGLSIGSLSPTYGADFAVRRLTPIECERLQGFPDNWTRIPYRGKPAEQCPDGPRYKACGNSMAVPVMRWIGERIQMMEDIMTERDLFGEVDK